MRIAFILIIAFAITAAEESSPAKLDRFKLTNGRTLVGTVESETAEAYNVKLAGGFSGSMVIRKDRVESIERGAEDAPPPVAVVPVDEQRPVAKPAESQEKAQEREAKASATDRIKQLRADAKKAGMVVTEAMVAEMKQGMEIKDVIAIVGDGFTREPYNNSTDAEIYGWKNKDGSVLRLIVQMDRGTVLGTPKLRKEIR